jgi:hypothetical protein
MVYNYSFCTAKKPQRVSITKVNYLVLFRSLFVIIIIRNPQVQFGQNTALLNVKVGGTYSYHQALNG